MSPHHDGDTGTQLFQEETLMRASRTFDGDSACIADARHHATAFLDRARAEHGLTVSQRARDLTALVVSELVTNACRHAPGPVLMELSVGADSVVVVVRDSSPVLPVARAADPERIGQHGLEIIEAITTDLFVEQEADGKRITARLSLTATS
ncbi:ATP-binding protein [Streptomyces sp. cmx-4-7]|uniref:ATP-binding protein n=1 Tax=Streptomyces sp. cmx-4-7 TaxID=2790939 RepID=UPI0039805265